MSNISSDLMTNHAAQSHEVPPQDETHLLMAAKNGRTAAFDALCKPYCKRLFQSAYRITRNHEDAEDALQDALLSAFVHLMDFHGKSSFSTWLTRIVINAALMTRRRGRSAHEISADQLDEAGKLWLSRQIVDRSPNPEQTYAKHEETKILYHAIRRLRPRLRTAIEMGELQELSMKETARVLDISVAAAKGRSFHGRAALRNSSALKALVQARKEPAA